MTTEQLEQEVPNIEIVENKEPIEIGDTPPEAKMAEDDPRAAIYAKAKARRQGEADGTPVGSERQEEAAPPPDPDQDEEVTVKVNGKEKKVPKAKIDEAGGVQAYQKAAAAAEELRLAKEERRRVQDYEQQLVAKAKQLQQYEEQIQQRAQQQPASTPPANADELKQMARQYHEAILNGDTDQADELLIKLQGAQKPATPDVDAIARRAAAEARNALQAERQAEMQRQFHAETIEAQAWFNDECADIAEDPELREWADQKTLKIMRENPTWRPKQIIEEAARQVREATGRTVSAAPVGDKLAVKRSMTNVKGGSARAAPRPVPKPPTRSEYVENLRKMRGLE